MSKVLVTGGAGFIGSNLCIELLRRGYEVAILDNFFTGKRENLREIETEIEIYEGDILDLNFVKEVVKGVDYILHQAALPSVPRSLQDPVTTNDINVKGTLNVLIAAKEENVEKVAYASSSSIYGLNPLPQHEEMNPMPLSPYAVSKLTGEYYAKVFYEVYGLETIILRYFNVFGPRQDPNSPYAAVIPKFLKLMIHNKAPEIYGDGKQSRDFTYIKNVVEANILALKKKNIGGKIFNIACGRSVSLNELVELMNKILGKNIKPIYGIPRKGDIRHSLADISKSKKLLGYRVKYPLEDGLRKTTKWLVDDERA